MRLIDADALLNIFSRYYGNDKIEVDDVIEWIEEQPTIEERKKGEWKPTDGASYKCSVCGRLSFYRTYYCAHCGADMT